ncbi:MAG: ATP-binding protein [Acetobacteraceae bacterium]|nr:two-component sensor histidine kinase [Pseudomonadota bacterium]
MRRYAAVGGLAALPILILLLFRLTGRVETAPMMLTIMVYIGAATGVLYLLARDIDMVAWTIRRMAHQDESLAPPEVRVLTGLAGEVARLSQRMATHAALVEHYRRADTQILERLPDPVIVLAQDRSVRRSNAAARQAFTAETPAVLRHPAVRSAIERLQATGESQTADLTLPAPVTRDLQATVVPIDPPLADGGAILLVLSDRTRERLFERMRADFVANVSHELRTPLASLIGFTETLRGPAADDKPAQQRFLAIMAEQGARMNRLIDDLLSLSRIEMTEHQAPAERLDLAHLVRHVAEGFEPRLAERTAKLSLQLQDDLPAVQADSDQITQVLQNLMDNAVKYGRDSGTISVTLAHAVPGGRWPSRPGVLVAVTDEGIGIPKQHLPRLTERFYRVDKGRSRAVGGTGLGLAIVKHIVNRHRGQLVIDSEEGKGTTVTVWLPAAQAMARMAETN